MTTETFTAYIIMRMKQIHSIEKIKNYIDTKNAFITHFTTSKINIGVHNFKTMQ